MAKQFFQLDFLNKLSARSRVLILFAGIIVVSALIYFATEYLQGGTSTVGASSVASTPSSVQAPTGSANLTPEYYKAIRAANEQAAKYASVSTNSALPNIVNTAQPMVEGGAAGSCTVICDDQASNVKYDLDDWVKRAKIEPETAELLKKLADKNVPISEYAAQLNRLVANGKLTPEQARQLLDRYTKQHANTLLKDSAGMMDDLIKSNQLPLDAANALLQAQKKGVSPDEYAAQLNELVKQGKISPQVAQQLLAHYTQQRVKEIIQKSISALEEMGRLGQITPDVMKQLTGLENQRVPMEQYFSVLKELVQSNKITPAVADKIADEYRSQKSQMGSAGTTNKLTQQAEEAAFSEINMLQTTGKITEAVAANLTDAINKNISFDEFQGMIAKMVQEKQLTPDIAKLKIADYKQVRGMRDLSSQLSHLQGNNASLASYSQQLKKAVQDGLLTPEQATQLMKEYQALNTISGGASANIPETADFAKLQKSVQATSGSGNTFSQAEATAAADQAQERQQRMSDMSQAMSTQAQQLIGSWQAVPMAHRQKEEDEKGGAKSGNGEAGASGKDQNASGSSGKQNSATPALIQAGKIYFAVLDTGANSDYPDSPVMATIVDGPYKGAKVLGRLQASKNTANQLDRVVLSFTKMSFDGWPQSKAVTAFAIDPDRARSAMASNVDYHYFKKYGALMAASFAQGYGQAIANVGTTTSGNGTTTQTTPPLSAKSKIGVALGQVGQNLSQEFASYSSIPPTVTVNSGVGLGILFMEDVT